MSAPYGVTLDAGGKIYVANYGNNTITVYAANPTGTLTEIPLATRRAPARGLTVPLA